MKHFKDCLIALAIAVVMFLAYTMGAWMGECDSNDWQVEDKGLKDPTYVEFILAGWDNFKSHELW